MAGLEGVTYSCRGTGWTYTGKPKRRKPNLDDLLATKAACDRSQAASDAIRCQPKGWRMRIDVMRFGKVATSYPVGGLEPLPGNFYRVALLNALREANAKPAPRKVAASKTVDVDPLEKIAAAVRARDESERRVRIAVEDARASGAGATAIARQLGVTRQAVYQLMARAA